MRNLVITCMLAAVALVVLACGPTDSPTATPGPATVQVLQDGSGDYASLEAAVSAVAPGSTIELGPGTFRLEAPLDIDKALQLVGTGIDKTILASEAAEYTVRFVGSGPFAATEITFRHEGQATADVVVVEGGEFAFAHCRFTGAYQQSEEGDRAGLRIRGSAIGVVEDSEATGNSSIGIWIQDQAQPKLERNSCLDNALFGIAFEGGARGTARRNLCSGSTAAGINVKGQAQPTLEDNGCTNNGTGIAYQEDAGGIARRNDCSANLAVGITVGNQAQPTLENNICNDNLYGIVYAGSEGGVASQNEASGNGVGLLVGEEAKPELEDNNIHDNEEEDIRDLRP